MSDKDTKKLVQHHLTHILLFHKEIPADCTYSKDNSAGVESVSMYTIRGVSALVTINGIHEKTIMKPYNSEENQCA
jgi:hypothetical protein